MIYPGTLYRNNKEMEVSGVIHFTVAYTVGFNFTLPVGETFKISCFTDLDDKRAQVWLENSAKFENQIVGEYLNSEKYDSFSLILTKEQIESFCESQADFSTAIYFYSSKEIYGEFSNFYESGFEYQKKYYPTVEHFYQSQKFIDPDYSEKIRLSLSPKIASELGMNRNQLIKENWDEIRNDLMLLGVQLKFQNNEKILKVLADSDDRLIIENSPYDGYWGIGKGGEGCNYLGIILMRVREILKSR